ncbi:MAG: hypothetical protein IJE59_01925 [Clostridia bacterium]|nr:hypothetical protein [Clostridia bacterium]
MKIFRKILILFLLSTFFTFLILIFFKPILTATNVIFPYSLHPFDIAHNYPKAWFYIKTIYCFSLFVTVFLTLNSLSMFFNFIKKPKEKDNLNENIINKNNLNLLVGINPYNQKQIFIPEKGLYQNILVTGTIGSRKNKCCNVSIFKTTN